jgi:small-conductance mechanosensitive channel
LAKAVVGNLIQLVGPHQSVQFLGVRLVGVNAENGKKLLFSLCFVVLALMVGHALHWLARRNAWDRPGKRFAFWARQGISIAVAVLLLIGLVSIWFDNPATLTTAAGMVAAGLAFALQRVVTAFAGYLVILRGKTFTVGDRITMGGIRGDVIALTFLQTVIMEMGQPAEGDSGDPMWVQARQYTGRIVRLSNAVIFDKPIYNYTREFPYIWEEMRLPVPYNADRQRAEQILLDVAKKHTVKIADLSEEALHALERRYVLKRSELEPQVYWRLTDNWLEMTVRFIVPDFGIRSIKSQMSRDILDEFDRAKIGIASGTYEVVGMPPLNVQITQSNGVNSSAALVNALHGQ